METLDGCCEDADECDDGNPCTFDLCFANQCLISPPGENCCTEDNQCNDNEPCTMDSCGADNACLYKTIAGCCDVAVGESLAKIEFDPDQVDGIQFSPSQGQFRWREHDSEAFDGVAAMYFGNNSGTNYCGSNTTAGPAGTATIPVQGDPFPEGVLSLPEDGASTVFFQVRLDMRKQADVDKLRLDVLEQGQVIGTVWTKADVSAYGQWVLAQVDLTPFAGKNIQLRFQFSVENPSAYGGCVSAGTGPRIDVFEVIASKCDPPAECETSDQCTNAPGACYAAKGECKAGTCEYEKIEFCCEIMSDCDDGDACTVDICVLSKCNHQGIPGCCAADNDCGTTIPCLVGVCNPLVHVCEFKVQDNCCATDIQCQIDENFCPGKSTCEDGICVQPPSDTTATLMNFIFTAGYDGWMPQPQNGQYRWREVDENFTSAPRSMFFGNNNSSHYCSPFSSSAPSGIAHLPGVSSSAFPTGTVSFDSSGSTTLTFELFLDVRSNPNVDKLAVRLDHVNGTQNTVWSKENLPKDKYGEWVSVSLDVTKYAPFIGTVRFFFDVVNVSTDGGCYNAGAGVFADDIKLVHSCN
jgi:hypothetical protein